jgi:hypothetical protein
VEDLLKEEEAFEAAPDLTAIWFVLRTGFRAEL